VPLLLVVVAEEELVVNPEEVDEPELVVDVPVPVVLAWVDDVVDPPDPPLPPVLPLPPPQPEKRATDAPPRATRSQRRGATEERARLRMRALSRFLEPRARGPKRARATSTAR
jgi:hypothetical protein